MVGCLGMTNRGAGNAHGAVWDDDGRSLGITNRGAEDTHRDV